jgi:hypothetical protein
MFRPSSFNWVDTSARGLYKSLKVPSTQAVNDTFVVIYSSLAEVSTQLKLEGLKRLGR